MTDINGVHPVADLFPMLAEDELAELAADIKQRGLLQPIVLDVEGRVLDGRNRLAACESAGIEPTFETYEGDDPDGYAFAVNVNRRHLRAGARHLLTEQARRLTGKSKIAVSQASGVHDQRLIEAGLVLDFAPDHVERVMDGGESLQTAVAVARERKREKAEDHAKKERLRTGAPDLLDQVADGRLDLDEAVAALGVREQKAANEAEVAQREEEERRSAEERAAAQFKQEQAESLERHCERVRMVITGWSTVRDLILPDSDGERASEILAGLGENDRLAIKRIVADIKEQS